MSETIECRVIGYHANYIDKLSRFINRNELVTAKDTHFFGDGMYFWDTPSNMHYWIIDKRKKYSKKDGAPEVCGVKAILSFSENEWLDLADKETRTLVFKYRDLIASRSIRFKDEMANLPLGRFINMLFENESPVIQSKFSGYKVIRGNLRYINMPNDILTGFNKFLKDKGMTIGDNDKIIYCVRGKGVAAYHSTVHREGCA